MRLDKGLSRHCVIETLRFVYSQLVWMGEKGKERILIYSFDSLFKPITSYQFNIYFFNALIYFCYKKYIKYCKNNLF